MYSYKLSMLTSIEFDDLNRLLALLELAPCDTLDDLLIVFKNVINSIKFKQNNQHKTL